MDHSKIGQTYRQTDRQTDRQTEKSMEVTCAVILRSVEETLTLAQASFLIVLFCYI